MPLHNWSRRALLCRRSGEVVVGEWGRAAAMIGPGEQRAARRLEWRRRANRRRSGRLGLDVHDIGLLLFMLHRLVAGDDDDGSGKMRELRSWTANRLPAGLSDRPP